MRLAEEKKINRTLFVFLMNCGLYYKHITIVNDDSRVVRMILQAVASPTIVIMMTLENIYSTGITDDRHLRSSFMIVKIFL